MYNFLKLQFFLNFFSKYKYMLTDVEWNCETNIDDSTGC